MLYNFFDHFREELESREHDSKFDPDVGTLRRASRMLETGKYDDRVYDALNISMANLSSSVNDIFYSKMRNMGYDAVEDMMDKRYSGYNANMPLVIFNKSKAIVDDIKKLEKSDIMDSIRKESTPIGSITSIASITAVPTIVIKLASKIKQSASDNRNDRKIINSYKKDHPNSKLSDRDIVRNYYGYK